MPLSPLLHGHDNTDMHLETGATQSGVFGKSRRNRARCILIKTKVEATAHQPELQLSKAFDGISRQYLSEFPQIVWAYWLLDASAKPFRRIVSRPSPRTGAI